MGRPPGERHLARGRRRDLGGDRAAGGLDGAARNRQQAPVGGAERGEDLDGGAAVDDAEADRALLQKARRALQAELEEIRLDHVDPSDTEVQRLMLKKQDLERAVEEQEDRVASAFERMKRAEAYANECQMELGKVSR